MKMLQGLPNKQFDSRIIGKITRSKKPFWNRKGRVLISDGKTSNSGAYNAILSSCEISTGGIAVQNITATELASLYEGDVVGIDPDGTVSVLWEIESIHNCFLVTDACNCKCIMCPQPPKKDNPLIHEQNLRVLALVEPEKVTEVCFTGGEPSLFPDRLVELMQISNKKFSKAHYDVLTNGVLFSDFDRAKRIALAASLNTTFCVSLHADVAEIHEAMTGACGSFPNVVKGIHNLAKLHQAIEIRPVITKLNFNRMRGMANYIYRNFPFAVHVAFMGMEIEGHAEENYSAVWIDPVEYASEIGLAAWELYRCGMNVSIYNIPLCLLSRESWRFARKSISGWKNAYLDECVGCAAKDKCCGVFTTSGSNQSLCIKSIDKL